MAYLILTLLSLAAFGVYLTYSLIKIGRVPQSFSSTYYLLGRTGKWFTVVMFAMAFLILPGLVEVTPDPWRIVAFLCPAAIAFVGAAPEFKITFALKVHQTAAIIAAVMGILWVVFFSGHWWVLPVSLVLAGYLAHRTMTVDDCKVFWLEMVAFSSVYTALILALL